MAITDKSQTTSKGDTPAVADNLSEYRMASTDALIVHHGQAKPKETAATQESKPSTLAQDTSTKLPLPSFTIVDNALSSLGNSLTNAEYAVKNIEFNREADFNNLYDQDYARLSYEAQHGDLITVLESEPRLAWDIGADLAKSVWDQR